MIQLKRLSNYTRTALSGKDFAVEFTELINPPFPPEPVIKLQSTNRQKLNIAIVVAPSGSPASKKNLIPEYPTRSRTNAPMSGIRGPLMSTIRPHIGPELYTPTVQVDQWAEEASFWQRSSVPFPASPTMFSCV